MTNSVGPDLYSVPLRRLNGASETLADYKGNVLLLVNVASRCGRTPQYAGLQSLYERYAARGFAVLGFPCNQFGNEEPGTADEIQEFCTLNYGVTFPLFEKIEVNGPDRHPLYGLLTEVADANGDAGDVAWNFEKFLIDREGRIVQRFRKTDEPEAEQVVSAIEALL